MKAFAVLTAILVVLMAGDAFACHIQIHAYDATQSQDADLEGVYVELFDADDNGLGNDVTDFEGLTQGWSVPYETADYYATGVMDGWVCDTVEDTYPAYTNYGWEVWHMPCVPDNEIPEFGVVGASLALVGALGITYLIRKRK